MFLHNVAIVLRTLQLYGQNAHNLTKGRSFFSDHEALSDFYVEAAESYDMVIERILGTEEKCDLVLIHEKTVATMKKLPHYVEDQKGMFNALLSLEKELCSMVNSMDKSKLSEGTVQLVGEIANRSEARQYLIKRRLMCKE